ncbi:MAG: VOC family protein [Verrucomicrobiota bacterium]|nr:VOC family protein [Verrucomicrobiota bacterium]
MMKNRITPKITPFLWFNDNAHEAVEFYLSVFESGRNLSATESGEDGGNAMTVRFELEGQQFIALNGGPHYQFNEAVSFVISCESQEEIDYFWDKLVAGGEPSRCGWLKDKFGLSWQVVPSMLGDVLGGDDEPSERALAAMLQMNKLIIADLQRAYDGS